jgi:leucine dehydrogenase
MSNYTFSQIEELGHEQVVYCHDKATGLNAIIAIHDTTACGIIIVWMKP